MLWGESQSHAAIEFPGAGRVGARVAEWKHSHRVVNRAMLHAPKWATTALPGVPELITLSRGLTGLAPLRDFPVGGARG
jgi:hypothetical protein